MRSTRPPSNILKTISWGAIGKLRFSICRVQVNNSTDINKLSELDKIFIKHSGKHSVYLKIISPNYWETLLMTDRNIKPSEDMLKEVEDLLGHGTAVLS